MIYQLHLNNDVNEVGLLAEWLEKLGEDIGLGPEQVFQLNLALEEAVVNVMNYAYPTQIGMPVDLEAEKVDDGVLFTLIDGGIAFDPLQVGDPDITLGAEDRPIGGLGIFLVRQIMSDLSYERVDNQNRFKMKFSL